MTEVSAETCFVNLKVLSFFSKLLTCLLLLTPKSKIQMQDTCSRNKHCLKRSFIIECLTTFLEDAFRQLGLGEYRQYQ